MATDASSFGIIKKISQFQVDGSHAKMTLLCSADSIEDNGANETFKN